MRGLHLSGLAAASLWVTVAAPEFLIAAQTTVQTHPPEPAGFWTGPINSTVPETIRGGKVIHASVLQTLLQQPGTVVIDVSNAPRRPDNLAPEAPWLPLPHQGIPGAMWLPGVGMGEIAPSTDTFFRNRLATATEHDVDRAVVIYCHEQCWLSWNAARRAIEYGYRTVYWFPDGIEGWRAAGFPTAVVEAQATP